jgi:hypothetical protein
MPAISKTTAPHVQDIGPGITRSGELDGHTVQIVSVKQTHDLAPLLKGLPDDRCQCPHWGYVIEGRITVTYADRQEVFGPGDAFSMTPGHTPAAEAGSEFVQFSPTADLAVSLAVIESNVQRTMQQA